MAWLSVGVDEAARFDVMVYGYCVGEEESMAPGESGAAIGFPGSGRMTFVL